MLKTSAAAPHVERLCAIGRGLREVLAAHPPDLIAVERVFINSNLSASLLLAEARGAALMALSDGNAPLLEISALQIKQSVAGGGRAGKKQVADMVGRILGISTDALAADSTDALACALTANTLHAIALPLRRRGRRRPLRAAARARR